MPVLPMFHACPDATHVEMITVKPPSFEIDSSILTETLSHPHKRQDGAPTTVCTSRQTLRHYSLR